MAGNLLILFDQVLQLRDFLDKICVLDPAKRITLNQCLTHPFIQASVVRFWKSRLIAVFPQDKVM